MADPQHTREWAVVEGGGPKEQERQEANIVHQSAVQTREFAPSEEGGSEELARGGEEFATEVMAKRAAKVEADAPVDEVAVKAELLEAMPVVPEPAVEEDLTFLDSEDDAEATEGGE